MTGEGADTSIADIVADTTAAFIDTHVNKGHWAAGYQLTINTPDGTSCRTGGTDANHTPLNDNNLFAIYCAGKPVTALLIGTLIDANEVSFNDQIGHIIDTGDNTALATTTIETILNHRAGLGGPHATDYLLMPPAVRQQRILHHQPQPKTVGGVNYSEYVGWELLKLAVETVCGEPFEHVTRTVLNKAGINDLWFTPPDSTSAQRISVNIDAQNGQLAPLIWEASPTNLADIRAASGAYATMDALARLYRATLNALQGQAGSVIEANTARTLTTPTVPANYDPTLRRYCTFTPGFMGILAYHRFATSHHPTAFGHTGLSGMTCAAADPARNLTYAVHLNTITDAEHNNPEPALNPELRRQLITQTILDTFDNHTNTTKSGNGH